MAFEGKTDGSYEGLEGFREINDLIFNITNFKNSSSRSKFLGPLPGKVNTFTLNSPFPFSFN